MTLSHARNLLAPLEAQLWYALLTAYEETEEEVSLLLGPTKKQKAILDKNRRIWNGFACRGMSGSERGKLAKLIDLNPKELEEWDSQDEKEIEKELRKRFSQSSLVQNYLRAGYRIIDFFDKDEIIRIENLTVANPFHAFKFIFPKISFGRSNFEQACFFVNCIFEDSVIFDKTHFQSDAYFRNTFFNVQGFGKINSFQGTVFDKLSDFEGTTFNGLNIFTGSEFNAHSVFNEAKFNYCVPQFYGTVVKQTMQFTYDEENWPRPEHDGGTGKESYACLRRIMHNQHKPDDEQFFYRQEMAWKAKHESPSGINWAAINLYKRLSDYGYNLRRPFWIFLIVLICPAFLLVPGTPQYSSVGYWGEIGCALRLSATNMFPLLEFASEHNMKCKFPPDNIKWLWHFVSLAQYLASVVLLFLFALALRTRFRLR